MQWDKAILSVYREMISHWRATYKLIDTVEVYLKEGELILDLLLEVLLIHDDALNVLVSLRFLWGKVQLILTYYLKDLLLDLLETVRGVHILEANILDFFHLGGQSVDGLLELLHPESVGIERSCVGVQAILDQLSRVTFELIPHWPLRVD